MSYSLGHRRQRTIARETVVHGVGFLTGADITLRFLPAPIDHGIAFQRVDCPGTSPVPARIDFAIPRKRRTAIESQGVTIEMTEHVMAALAGLQVDNCLVQLDAPEPPGCDGSALDFTRALLDADFVEQDAPRARLTITRETLADSSDGACEVIASPPIRPDTLTISYRLDYGADSPIPVQDLTLEITPDSFIRQIAPARTFILESEVKALQAQGYGSRTTARDLLVFGEHGVIDNQLRIEDECVRHKILDCLGDFALIGCDLAGHFEASRSGHELNREVIRRLRATHPQTSTTDQHRAA